MTDYKIWKPEHDGHAPPNWREGMPWDCEPFNEDHELIFDGDPAWWWSTTYKVPAEALNSPNDDDRSEAEKKADEKLLKATLKLLRQYPADELAKHGITLAPEKDWARELAIDFLAAGGWKSSATRFFDGDETLEERAAIDLLRTRFEQMKGEA